MPHRTPRALAFLALAVLAACGGSGGGGGGGGGGPVVPVLGDEAFQGDYFAVLKAGGHGLAAEARGGTGIVVADGAGVVVHSQIVNDSGVVSGPETTPYEFDVAPDGTLELVVPAGVFARGGISTDGTCALLGSAAPGASPGIIVLHRREGQYAASSLSGNYRLVSFLFAPGSGNTAAGTGSVLFDGVGILAGSSTINIMGSILVGPIAGSTYSVVADGTSALSLGGIEFEGGVVNAGAVAVWGGSITDTQNPGIVVAVKEAASTTVATLQGAYWIVSIQRDPVTDDFISFHGTATADGAGGLSLLITTNVEGVLAAQPPQSIPYAVTASGQLTIDPALSALVGGVSQDGSFAAVAGGTSPGENPILVILRRK